MAVLITGGTGYIGSHTCVEMLNSGEKIVVVDNFINSKPLVIQKIKNITGKDFKFYETDILDSEKLDNVFSENDIEAVIHFAGLKAVGESVSVPLKYYHNNITGTLNLCEIMSKYKCKKIVFSSSATVYGDPDSVPVKETFPLRATNPYGRTKLMIEQILNDIYISDNTWGISLLRYFNPIGAHESGEIGEEPSGIPNNLMPYINQVASGKLPYLKIYGNDYDTPDGTGVRDYIHVTDLSNGHLKALNKIRSGDGIYTYNLGTGNGYSVMEVVSAFEKASGIKIPCEICPRRPGDIAECYSDTAKAKSELQWEAVFDINRMCADSWNFVAKNRHS